jgi:methionine sulfoxide reductase heme-binding subunit
MHIVLNAVALARAAASTASTTGSPLWYLTRAAAVSAYVTITAGVVLGLSRSIAGLGRIKTPWTLDEAHQFLAVLTAGFVLLHLVTLLFDHYNSIAFSLVNLLVPLNEPYAPLAVDLGIVSMYALAIVLFSSWLRRRIANVTWRALHYLGFAVFALVTLHGLLAGSDSASAWMRLIYIAAVAVVGLLVFIRFFAPPSQTPVQPRRYTASRP